jgi:hypothetical protein
MRCPSRRFGARLLLLGLISSLQAACGATTNSGPASGGAGASGGSAAASGASAGASIGGGGQVSGGSAGEGTAGAVSVEGCELEDQVVARAVTAALGAEPSAEKLGSLKELVANGATSLKGIECLPNLESVISMDGGLTDVTPLASLTHLRFVQVARNQIADLSPLSANLKLERLKAANNGLQSLRGLTLPPPDACSELVLDFNPLSAADVAFACDAGWPVTWGGTTLQNIEACNAPCLK